MAQQILYIPGFGDHRPQIQLKLLKGWERRGAAVHYEPINWYDDEAYEAKFERVLKQIDQMAGQGKISLVGVSAGASLAMNAYIARKDRISGAVFICGKLRNAEGVNQRFFKQNPAFKKSIFTCQDNVLKLTAEDKAKMLTLRSAWDGLIPAADSRIPGVKDRVIPFIIHVPTIFVALSFFKRRTLSFLKAQAE